MTQQAIGSSGSWPSSCGLLAWRLVLYIGSVHSVMDLGLLPSDLLEVYKYRLKASARTRNWLEVTGGIAGEAFGLEADALGGKRVRQAYGDAVASYLARSRSSRGVVFS